MRCYRAQEYISEYVDGTLSPKHEISLLRHIGECSDCRAVLEDFRRMAQEAKDLRKLTPSDAVLLNVATRLREQRSTPPASSPRRRWIFASVLSWLGHGHWQPRPATNAAVFAAGLILLLIIGLLYYQPWRTSLGAEKAAIDQLTLKKLDEAERHYEQAIRALSDATAAQHGNLDARVTRVFEVNLAMVEESIEACRQAVKRDPRDLEAQEALMASYKEKVQLMTELIVAQSSSEPKGASGSPEESGIGL